MFFFGFSSGVRSPWSPDSIRIAHRRVHSEVTLPTEFFFITRIRIRDFWLRVKQFRHCTTTYVNICWCMCTWRRTKPIGYAAPPYDKPVPSHSKFLFLLPKINVVHWIIFPSSCWNIVFDFCLVVFGKHYFMMAKNMAFTNEFWSQVSTSSLLNEQRFTFLLHIYFCGSCSSSFISILFGVFFWLLCIHDLLTRIIRFLAS